MRGEWKSSIIYTYYDLLFLPGLIRRSFLPKKCLAGLSGLATMEGRQKTLCVQSTVVPQSSMSNSTCIAVFNKV